MKHGIKTLAACGGIRGVDDTSSYVLIHNKKVTFKRKIFITNNGWKFEK
jgi:hypothetical protein